MTARQTQGGAGLGGGGEYQTLALGPYVSAVERALKRMERERFLSRLWQKDATLWKDDPAHQQVIQDALGWLTVPHAMLGHTDGLRAFAAQVRADGFQAVVLLGMGGSSLCAEVFRRTFGKKAGFPDLWMLDSTDPATVARVEGSVDLARTLFIVASKSGTTTEPLMFYRYFFDRVSRVKRDHPGNHFIAITDSGTPLAETARRERFHHVFLNPPDIGGRYSALSYFGLVPAALMGLDVRGFLERAVRAVESCGPEIPTDHNPAARLGAILGGLAGDGRDKITLVASRPVDSLGLWVEQLVAESTGKEGRGILPVAGEPLGPPGVYGDDRVFVSIGMRDGQDFETDAGLTALKAAGHPVVHHRLQDPLSLGAEFFVWEVATALAGALLRINPFDQPNVQESKDYTNRLLELYRTQGKLPEEEVLVEEDGCRMYCDGETRAALRQAGGRRAQRGGPLAVAVGAHLARAGPGDYVALTAFIPETATHDALLQAIRTRLRDGLKLATTVGYGPRFLHSTGQMHKGGPDRGVWIQVTADDPRDLPIPGEPFTFGVLKQAQALGDYESLSRRRRRAMRFHAGRECETGLRTLLRAVEEALDTS